MRSNGAMTILLSCLSIKDYETLRYYDPELRRFISADDMQYLGAGDKISGYNLFAYCNNNLVVGYDPTGNWDWGGVIVGAGLMGTAVVAAAALAVCGGPVSAPVILATIGVFAAGAVVTYAAATDSAIVVDMSSSYQIPILPIYGKGGGSSVIDFINDNVNIYPHVGGGVGLSNGSSASIGWVDNYEKPDDYEKHFIGGNIGYWFGADHCWDPRKEHNMATQATSSTFSPGFSVGAEYAYFLKALQILEW